MKNILFILLGISIGVTITAGVWMLQPDDVLNLGKIDLPQITFQTELNNETARIEPVFTKEQQNKIQSGAIEPFIKSMEVDGYAVVAVYVRQDGNQGNLIIFDAILARDGRLYIYHSRANAYQNEDGTYKFSPGTPPDYRG